MARKAITIETDEAYLRQISKPVERDDKEILTDVKELEEYCQENEVMAMAAVQIGIPKRLIYLKNTNLEIINKIQTNSLEEKEKNYNEAKILINPTIISREGLTTYWEACESCLDNLGLVKRPYKIQLQYWDLKGKKHLENFEGFESTVLSHELDHLDGILHIDKSETVLQKTKEERKLFRQSHGYEIISKTGKYEDLKNE